MRVTNFRYQNYHTDLKMLPKNTKEKLEEPKGKITIKSDIDLKKNKKELLI